MELKKLMTWLSGFPGFAGMTWAMDCLPHKPGMATLTSKGITVLDTVEDVLGNRKKTLQITCILAFSGQNMAQMLLDLQHWVQLQDAPQLGQGRKSAALQEGRHLQENKLGLSIYTAQLTVTYENFYEVNENGEN